MAGDVTSAYTTATLVRLAEIGEAINANVPLDTIFYQILAALTRLVACDAVTIGLTNPDNTAIALHASVDGQGQPLSNRVGPIFSVDELPTVQTILDSKGLLYLPDTRNSPLWRNNLAEFENPRAFLGAPIIVEEKIIGVLFIDFFYVTDPLTEELRYAVLAFTRYAAAAIRNTRQREQLLRSEERYRLATALTSDAVYEWVVGSDMLNWSGDIDALLKYEPGSFPRTYQAWFDAIHAKDKHRIENAMRLTIQEGATFEEEYRLLRADGSYCYVLDRGLIFDKSSTPRMLGTISDLTNTYELTDALVESEVRYRTLFARSLDAIFVIDSQGMLVDFNPAAEALVGRDYTRLVSSDFHDLVAPRSASDYKNALHVLQARSEVSNIEITFSKPHNGMVEAEMWGTALGGGLFQFVARDISTRKQSQLLAAQRVAELTALSDVTRATAAGGDVVEILNRVLPGAMNALEMPLGRIYLADTASKPLQVVAQVGDWEHSPLPATLPRHAADSGRVTPFSSLVRVIEPTTDDTRTSLQVPLVSNGKVIGLVVFTDTEPRTFVSTDIYLMDIIGRELSIGVENARLLDNLEQLVQERTVALYNTETRYRSLIEQVPGVVYTADSVYSGVSFISGGANVLFGLTPIQIMHASDGLLNCVSPEDLPAVREQVERAIAAETDFDAQYRVINVQTNRTHWVNHRARLILAGAGDMLWLGLITDVTQLKELDMLKSQFVATVSHELRTPLSAIKLRAATLSSYYERLTDQQRLDTVQRISYQADILADLIEDVLRLAKLDGDTIDRQVEAIDLNLIGLDVVEELRPSAEAAGLMLLTFWAAHKCTINGDAMDMTRIWRNLISNAIKYTNMPGVVKVYTGYVAISPTHTLLSTTLPESCIIMPNNIKAGNWVVGVVTDSGKGISDYDYSHIFTRFFRGEAALTNIPGTGLGLSLVKELLDDYGGHIALRSELGVGSTFAFWLPAADNTEEEV